MPQIEIHHGFPNKNYETGDRNPIEDLFDKACEYIDVSTIRNTEAQRFGDRGNGVMAIFAKG